MKKLLLLLAPLAFIIGCDPITGSINLVRPLTYMNVQNSSSCHGEYWDPSCDQPSEVTISKMGTHELKIDQVSKSTLQITVKVDKKKHVIQLDTRKKKVPANGVFSLVSSESGQPFDVVANLKTTVTDGPMIHDNFRCEVRQSEPEHCVITVTPITNPNNIRHCVSRVSVYVGDQDQDFFNRTTRTDLVGRIIQSSVELANMNGSRQSTQKIVTYDSGCKNTFFSNVEESWHDEDVPKGNTIVVVPGTGDGFGQP